jgi:phospholipase C
MSTLSINRLRLPRGPVIGAALIALALLAQACVPVATPTAFQGVATAASPSAIPPAESLSAPPATPQALGSSTPTRAIPAFTHIFVIVMENKEFGSVIGSAQAPYLNGLANQFGLATNYFAIGHPSLPNYLALIGGSTFGITSDCTDCFVDKPSLVDQLEAAGKTWNAYMEGMPAPCKLGDYGNYAQKHDPFIYFDGIRKDDARCGRIVPFEKFPIDLQAGSLPDFVWITPDLCHDAHDCPLGTGDDWLKQWVPAILGSSEWKAGSVLFITFDEGQGDHGCCEVAKGGRVATLVISPYGKPGFQSAQPYDHYALLRTIEDAWGLPSLGAAADIGPMTDFFQR